MEEALNKLRKGDDSAFLSENVYYIATTNYHDPIPRAILSRIN